MLASDLDPLDAAAQPRPDPLFGETGRLAQIAGAFAGSGEFVGATAGKSNGEVVEFMYANTLDRSPDADGLTYWTGRLDAGLSRGDLLLEFSQSAEHYNLYANQIIGGIDVLI